MLVYKKNEFAAVTFHNPGTRLLVSVLLPCPTGGYLWRTPLALNTQAVEIIKTEVVLEEAWSLNHSRVMHRIGMALLPFADRYDILPELEFELVAGRLKLSLALLPCLTWDWAADVLRYPQPPVTAIEILTPTQALDAVITKIRQYYFTSGVQSAWLVIPIVQHIYLFLPGQPPQVFTSGTLRDQAAQVEVALADIFR